MALRNHFPCLTVGALLVCIGTAYPFSSMAIDTSTEEKTCSELGFKKKTEKFGECVLTLAARKGPNPTQQITTAQVGDGTQDDQTCQKYGFKPGQSDYASCRMQIDQAKRQAAQEQVRYQAELAAYQQRLAEAKRQKEHEEGLKLLEFSLRGLSGEFDRSRAYSLPSPPTLRSNQTIRLPNGNQIYCSTVGSSTNCN